MQTLLEQSTRQYEALLQGIATSAGTLASADTTTIAAFTSWFDSSMEQIKETDALILRNTGKNSNTAIQALRDKRMALMETVRAAIHDLKPLIQAAIAMHKTELAKIRSGMQLTGYASHQDHTGRRISGNH